MPVTLKVKDNKLIFNDTTSITFHRTLRIPDDGKTYPLPPSFGLFPICKVDDYLDKVPASWKSHGGVFLPMWQREAMWVQFEGKKTEPKACKIAVGKVNAINGKPYNQKITADQDYVVIPDQPWIDGINSGDGTIKQFVAMPLGSGHSVEAQVTGKEEHGGVQLIVFDRKASRAQPVIVQKPVAPPVYNPPVYYPTPQPVPKPVPTPPPVYAPMVNQMIAPNVAYNQPAMPKMLRKKAAPMKFAAITQESKSAAMMQESEQAEAYYDDFDNFEEAATAPPPPPQAAPMMDYFAAPPPAPLGGMSGPPPPAPSMTSVTNSMQNFGFTSSMVNTTAFVPPIQPQVQKQKEVRMVAPVAQAKEMNLAAGGKMKQKIYEDVHGYDTWDENNYARVFVHIVNSAMFYQITGKNPPDTPIDASAYTNFGMPWFDVYDESTGNVKPSDILANVKSVKEVDQQKYAWPQQNDNSVYIPSTQVQTVIKKDDIRDGDW